MLFHTVETFLPQLLRYPNPSDPLNGEAAALLMREPKNYDIKVKGVQAFRRQSLPVQSPCFTQILMRGLRRLPFIDYVQRYASKEPADDDGDDDDDEEEVEMSDVGSNFSDDEEAAGEMDL